MRIEIKNVPRRKNPALIVDDVVVAYFLSEKYAEQARQALLDMLEEVRVRAESDMDPGLRAMFMQLQRAYEDCAWDLAEELESAIGQEMSDEKTKIVLGRTATRTVTLEEFTINKSGSLTGPRFAGYFSNGYLTRVT